MWYQLLWVNHRQLLHCRHPRLPSMMKYKIDSVILCMDYKEVIKVDRLRIVFIGDKLSYRGVIQSEDDLLVRATMYQEFILWENTM